MIKASDILVYDIETQAVKDFQFPEGSAIHCIVCQPLYGQPERYHDDPELPREGTLDDGFRRLANWPGKLAGHNVLRFDRIVVEDAFGEPLPDHLDTQLLCEMRWPHVKELDFRRRNAGDQSFPSRLIGRQSLEAWGYRLGVRKGDFGKQTGWHVLDRPMLDYCVQDVKVTAALMERILKYWPGNQAVELEHRFAEVIWEQIRAGVKVDRKAAADLLGQLTSAYAGVYDKLVELCPPFEIPYVTPKKKLRRTKVVPFNPGSRLHCANHLIRKYGWKPKQFTDSGRPQLDEAILESLAGVYAEAALMNEYLMLGKRIGQLEGSSKAGDPILKYLKDDDTIHGEVRPCGTVTMRCAHKKPNLGQIPRPGSKWGTEFRALFGPKNPGWVMVGADASGLETRELAHFLHQFDGGRMVDIVLSGDVHSTNMQALEIMDRNRAKVWFYAWLYGAGDAKLGLILGCSARRARAASKRFLRNTPGMPSLKQLCSEHAGNYGWLPGCDGRRIPVRHQHSALNTLLQGNGAIVVKMATVLWADAVKEEGLRAHQVLHVHDEAQYESHPDDAQRVGEIGVESFRKAGEILGIKCPLDGEYKVGANWSETH